MCGRLAFGAVVHMSTGCEYEGVSMTAYGVFSTFSRYAWIESYMNGLGIDLLCGVEENMLFFCRPRLASRFTTVSHRAKKCSSHSFMLLDIVLHVRFFLVVIIIAGIWLK